MAGQRASWPRKGARCLVAAELPPVHSPVGRSGHGARFDQAMPRLLVAIQEGPSFAFGHRFLAACYAHMGRLGEAREVVVRLRAFTPVVIPDLGYLRNPEHRELLLSGLRLATGETD